MVVNFFKQYSNQNQSIPIFVDSLGKSYANSKGKSIWGEKTPAHSLRLEKMHELFPEARVIWIKRDPRDVIISYVNRWNNRNYDDEKYILKIAVLLKYYLFKLIFENPYIDIIEISYEKLANDPNGTLKHLFQELNLEYKEEYSLTKNFIKNDPEAELAHKNLNKPINSNSVGQGLIKLPSSILEKVEELLDSELKHLGYQRKTDKIDVQVLHTYLDDFEKLKNEKVFKKNRFKYHFRMYYEILNPFISHQVN